MSDLVPKEDIEQLVGAKRDPLRHLGRAVSETETIYILHSGRCKASGIDLRDCSYSRLLDLGIDRDSWAGYEDQAVVLGILRFGLIPMRKVVNQ